MGKIQSAVTGLVMSSIGAVASQKKIATAKAEQTEKQEARKIESDASDMYGKALQGATDKQINNLVKRQEEANQIAQHFVMTQRQQREVFKQRIAKVGGVKTPEGKQLLESSKTAYEANLKQHQQQMDKLRKRVYNKKGDKK